MSGTIIKIMEKESLNFMYLVMQLTGTEKFGKIS